MTTTVAYLLAETGVGLLTEDGDDLILDLIGGSGSALGLPIGARFEIWLSRDDGTRLMLLDQVVAFEYAISLHQIGACVLELPGSFAKTFLGIDNRLEIWRAPADGVLRLERVYLIRRVVDRTDQDGVRTLVVMGVDGNHLLRRRHVVYPADSSQTEKFDYADDMVREIVYENLGAGVPGGAEARSFPAGHFSIGPEHSNAVIMKKGFAWRNVLTVCQDIADAAYAQGTPFYWHVADISPEKWEFQTYSGQPGIDHTWPDGQNPVLLGLEYGNLAEPVLDEDYTDEVTAAYACGQGEGRYRVYFLAEDTARSGRSLFGRYEGLQDARNEATDDGVLAEAYQLLQAGRPRRTFGGRIIETPGTRYGVHWRWGDRVTATYDGATFEAMIRAVRVKVSSSGRETIDARLEVLA